MQVNTKKKTVTLTKQEVKTLQDASELIQDLAAQRFVELPPGADSAGKAIAEVAEQFARKGD